MAKKFSKKIPHNGKKSVTANQLVLDLLDAITVQQTTPLVAGLVHLDDEVSRMAGETWSKIEAAFAKPTTPEEFAEETLQLLGEYRVFLGEYEWSCKLPENATPEEPVVPLMPEPQLPVLATPAGV